MVKETCQKPAGSRHLINDTQFIISTNNKKTMSKGEMMSGVTMSEYWKRLNVRHFVRIDFESNKIFPCSTV